MLELYNSGRGEPRNKKTQDAFRKDLEAKAQRKRIARGLPPTPPRPRRKPKAAKMEEVESEIEEEGNAPSKEECKVKGSHVYTEDHADGRGGNKKRRVV